MDVIQSPGLPRGFSFGSADTGATLHLGPSGLLYGPAADAAVDSGAARPLCGSPIAYAMVTAYVADAERLEISTAPLSDFVAWAERQGDTVRQRVANDLEVISSVRPPFAGMGVDRPRIFGIVNVTPDSFSDGGEYYDPSAAIARGRALIEAGADALDIGGESTRPGAEPVSEQGEIDRVVPVIHGLADAGVPLSVDTRRASVMRAALDAGARIINDVSALTDDAHAIAVAVESGAPVILMHKRGEPATMHHDPVYDHVTHEVFAYLRARVDACVEAGIAPANIAVDPGIGFGKTMAHNRQLLAEIAQMHGIGCPVMVGASRKFGRGSAGRDRLGASLSAASWAVLQGVQLVRVHDVAETRQALQLIGGSIDPPRD